MPIPKDVKNALIKVFEAIREDPTKLTNLTAEYCGEHNERAYTVRNLENLACNHLFDDNPQMFRITELEGCTIRHYFSIGPDTYDFVEDLRKEFPDFFKHPESQEYLDQVNNQRRTKGLSPTKSKFKGTILYVEDQPEAREYTTEFLEDEGFLVLPCKDGKEAFDTIQDGLNYNLLLLDLSLRYYSGDEIAKLSRTKNPKIPIITVSGYNKTIPEANTFFDKPTNLERLIETINNLISHSK